MTHHQGITPLTGKSLSASAEAYFAQSEQAANPFELSFGKFPQPALRQDDTWRAWRCLCCNICPKRALCRAGRRAARDVLSCLWTPVDGRRGAITAGPCECAAETVDELELIGAKSATTDLLETTCFTRSVFWLPRYRTRRLVDLAAPARTDRVRKPVYLFAGDN